MMVGSITIENLREAQSGLVGVAQRTPLLPLDMTAEGITTPVRLKAEQLQPIGAFKIRGAWTAVRRLSSVACDNGVITSSSGNHGLGIAFAAARLGIRAVVVMPESAASVKIEGVRKLGARVVLAGKTRGPEQTAAAQLLVEKQGLTLIPPYDHPDVIAGQGTVGLEILEDWPEVTTIMVPVGGGGLLAGICSAVRALRPDVKVIAVEPANIPKLSAAFAAGEPSTITGGASLADGLLGKSVGQLTWPLIRETVKEVVQATDQEIVAAVRWLAARDIRVEPSGAVTTAALLAHKVHPDGPVAVVCTGGNVDPAQYAEFVA